MHRYRARPTKVDKIIKVIQKEYHYSLGEIYQKFPEIKKMAWQERLAQIKRDARIKRWKLIRK